LDVKDGKLKGIMLKNQVLGGTDESGRRSPEAVKSDSFYIPCDTLILAIGQQSEEIPGLDIKSGSIIADPVTLKTNIDGVYAGGDAVNVKSIIAAVAMGKRAAMAMSAYITGEDFTPEPLELPTVDPEAVLARNAYFPRRGRTDLTTRCGTERVKDFNTYTRVLTEAEAVAEAERCLNCGCGEGCQTCRTICCDFAVDLDGTDKVKINDKDCVACGMCFNRCPNKNIEMVSLNEVA
jgi:heterodisulfide reductase subunit A-like polyferredoxin